GKNRKNCRIAKRFRCFAIMLYFLFSLNERFDILTWIDCSVRLPRRLLLFYYKDNYFVAIGRAEQRRYSFCVKRGLYHELSISYWRRCFYLRYDGAGPVY